MENKKRNGIIYMLMFLFSCIYIVGNKGYVVNAEIKSNNLFVYDIGAESVGIIGLSKNADKDITTLTIPSQIDGLPVKQVGLYREDIPEYANNFYKCKNLKTLIIEDGIEEIYYDVFSGCSNLENVTLPESLITIQRYAFSDCSNLTSIVFHEKLEFIGSDAFLNCKSLKQINIPASVEGFDDGDGGNFLTNPFRGCSGLASISVDPNNSVFYSSKDGINYNAIIYNQDEVLYVGCSNTKIPSTVKSIGVGAFYGCSGLTSIEIPNGVRGIGRDAFYGCSGLTSIEIPKSVTYVGAAFKGCSSLASITVDEQNTVYDSRDNCNAIIETSNNSLVSGCKNTIIPESVTSMGEYAFRECSSLTSITIPDNVTSIRYRAFYGCSDLTSVTLSQNLTEIGSESFANCSNLASVTLPEGLTTIGRHAFANCKSLRQISIPASVENIEEDEFDSNPFWGCRELVSISVDPNNPKYYSFEGTVNYNAVLYKDDNNKDVVLLFGCSNTKIPSGVTIIGEGAFDGCDGLTSIEIPNSVKTIQHRAFRGCSGLTNIEIPNSVTTIEWYAFSGCNSLTSITIPGSVTNIGDNPFYECESLKTIYTDKGSYADTWAKEHGYTVKYTGASDDPGDKPTNTNPDTSKNNQTTGNQSSTDNNTSQPNQSAQSAQPAETGTKLTSTDNTFKVTSSDASNPTVAFTDTKDKKTTSVNVPDTVTINNITYKVTSIENNAFSNNKKITKVTIGKNVTSIGKNAFGNCKKLKTITIKSTTLKSIGKNALKGINKKAVIKVPKKQYKAYKKLLSKKTGFKKTMKIKK